MFILTTITSPYRRATVSFSSASMHLLKLE